MRHRFARAFLALLAFFATAAHAAAPTQIGSNLSSPGVIAVDSGYAYFADDVKDNGLTVDGSLKRVPLSGGAIEVLADHTTQYDSGSVRGIYEIALTTESVIAAYGGYITLNVIESSKAPGTVSLLFVNRGGGIIGTVSDTLFYSRSFCCINQRSLSTGTTTQLISGYFVRTSDVDENAIYFTDYYSKNVLRLDLSTKSVTTLITNNTVEPLIFTSDDAVYANVSGTILRVDKMGGTVTTVVNTGTAFGYAADLLYVYYVENGTLYAAALAGGPITTLASNVYINGLAQDEANLYWTDARIPGQGVIWKIRKPSTPVTCPSEIFVGVRGSGEPYSAVNQGMGNTVQAVYAAAAADIIGLEAYGVPYDAIPVLPIDSFLDNVDESVEIGRQLLVAYLSQKIESCPTVAFLLVGYSQGAMVVADVIENLDEATAAHVVGVGLLGDPLFNPTSKTAAGDFNKKLYGILGMRLEFEKSFVKKTTSICINGDPICNASEMNLAYCWFLGTVCPHFEYTSYPLTKLTYAQILGEWLAKKKHKMKH